MNEIDDIKKALKACAEGNCNDCPNRVHQECVTITTQDALELIEQLEAEAERCNAVIVMQNHAYNDLRCAKGLDREVST